MFPDALRENGAIRSERPIAINARQWPRVASPRAVIFRDRHTVIPRCSLISFPSTGASVSPGESHYERRSESNSHAHWLCQRPGFRFPDESAQSRQRGKTAGHCGVRRRFRECRFANAPIVDGDCGMTPARAVNTAVLSGEAGKRLLTTLAAREESQAGRGQRTPPLVGRPGSCRGRDRCHAVKAAKWPFSCHVGVSRYDHP